MQAEAQYYRRYREAYFEAARKKAMADGNELIYGRSYIPVGGARPEITLAFFRGPKSLRMTPYFLVAMANSPRASKTTVEGFVRDAADGIAYLPSDWQIPAEYPFLKEARIAPKSVWTYLVRVALLASENVTDDAKSCVLGEEFQLRSGAYRIAAIVDTRANVLYMNKSPGAPWGISSLRDTLLKYFTG